MNIEHHSPKACKDIPVFEIAKLILRQIAIYIYVWKTAKHDSYQLSSFTVYAQ